MKPGKKIQRRLDKRVADFNIMMASGKHEFKVEERLRTGGFTCPGSRKK